MKIVFLSAANSIHTVKWVNEMANRGHDVHLISLHEKNDLISPKVNVYLLKFKAPYGYYINYFQAKNIIRKIQPDILNAHYASGYGTLARYVDFHPILLSVWGSDIYEFPDKSKINRNIIINNIKAADWIASTSNTMAKRIEIFNKEGKKISVTPFGVDTQLFKPKKIHNNDTITIGTVKSLEIKYGIEYLIRSFHLLLSKLDEEKNPLKEKLQLLIVGGGSLLGKLQSLVKELGIENKVKFIGKVPNNEVPKWLNKLDIYCAPSISESFGVAVVEASSCGIPVIVSNTGGLPEVVKDGVTGYLIPPKDYVSLYQKLYELVKDKQKRIQMGLAGRKFILENYDWHKCADKMENLYKDVISYFKNRIKGGENE